MFDESGGACPHTIQLAPGQDIRPASVVCSIDGAGASGSFILCLDILSQDGVLVSRTTPPVTFAVGDTGVATFAPFLGREAEAPVAGGVTAFAVNNDLGAPEWADIWLVNEGVTAATQLTSNAVGTFYQHNIVSPDFLHIAFQLTAAIPDRDLAVINIDGSGVATLVTGPVVAIQWIDNDAILYQDNTLAIQRINRDGTGAATIVSKAGIDTGSPSPDGTKVAYIAVTGGVTDLWVINADGTGDTKIVANIGFVSGAGGPVWRLDGSAIMYPKGTGMNTVNPDGTGDTVQAAVLPFAFWVPRGMATDRFFFTHRVDVPHWRLAQVVFGTGQSDVTPALYMSRSIFRGDAVYGQGRVFTVQDGVQMGGVDSVVSVLPDGSDYTQHFNPDQSGAPLFQTPSFE
jgi:hypothetical protein